MDQEQVTIRRSVNQGVSAKVGGPHEAAEGVARIANDELLKCV